MWEECLDSVGCSSRVWQNCLEDVTLCRCGRLSEGCGEVGWRVR